MKTIISLSNQPLYVTYGMSKDDVQRREKDPKEFAMVGMSKIVELHKSRITPRAIKNAESFHFVACVLFNKDTGKELEFKEL